MAVEHQVNHLRAALGQCDNPLGRQGRSLHADRYDLFRALFFQLRLDLGDPLAIRNHRHRCRQIQARARFQQGDDVFLLQGQAGRNSLGADHGQGADLGGGPENRRDHRPTAPMRWNEIEDHRQGTFDQRGGGNVAQRPP